MVKGKILVWMRYYYLTIQLEWFLILCIYHNMIAKVIFEIQFQVQYTTSFSYFHSVLQIDLQMTLEPVTRNVSFAKYLSARQPVNLTVKHLAGAFRIIPVRSCFTTSDSLAPDFYDFISLLSDDKGFHLCQLFS